MTQAMTQATTRAWSFVARRYSIPLLLLVWQLAVGSGLVESRLLPSPTRVWTALVTDLGDGTLLYHAGVTLYRALTGFVLAALIGIPFAVAMARSTLIRNLFEPIFFFGYPVPKIALCWPCCHIRVSSKTYAPVGKVAVPTRVAVPASSWG